MPGGTERRSFCRVCNAMCGIVVTVEERDGAEVVTRIRGDDEHPLSRGYTCQKGRALGVLHHDPGRLDRPRLGRGADRRTVGWEELLDDLAAGLRAAADERGPDGAAMYLASGSAFDAAGRRAAERFLSVSGSRQRYTATTIDTPCKPLVAEAVGGWSGLTPVWDHERSRLLVLIGCNPVVSHGHSNAIPDPVERLRGFRARGGEVWVVDPRRTETARLADRHLQLRPGSDWVLLAWLVRRLLDDDERRLEVGTRATGVEVLWSALGPVSDAVLEAATGVAAADAEALLGAVRRSGRVSALTGTGTSMAATANVTELLLWALHVATDSYDRPGGMWFNPGYLGRLDERSWEPADGEAEPGPPSRPELPRRFGEWPCAGLVSEIEAGNVRALLVVGGNPVTAFPDVERTRAALASLDVLAVVDVVPGETTELATHVLPAVDQLERADTTWLLDTYQLAVAAQWTDAVVAPLAERRPVWWMFGALGQRLGVDPLPRGVELASASDADVLAPLLARSVDGDALRSSPTGVAASGAVFGWVREKVLPPGGWRLAPAPLIAQLEEHVEVLSGAPGGEVRTSGGGSRLVLVPHRQMATMNSQLRDLTAPGARPASVAVLAHPSVVEALGGPGTPVSVRSPWGALVGPLRVDDRLHPEAVAVAHGWDHPNVSALTSATEAIDPLTGMVLQSGVPVTLEPAT